MDRLLSLFPPTWMVVASLVIAETARAFPIPDQMLQEDFPVDDSVPDPGVGAGLAGRLQPETGPEVLRQSRSFFATS